MAKNKKTRTLVTQEIVDDFRSNLIKGNLKPGDKLLEEELIEKYSSSRTTVREAMKTLKALGVVETHWGKGSYITKDISSAIVEPLIFSLILKDRPPKQLVELREMLEVGILEIILEKVTDEDVKRMEKAITNLELDTKNRVTDTEVLMKHDLDFHYAFIEVAHNPLIEKVGRAVYEMFLSSIHKSVQTANATKRGMIHHREILEGIKEKNFDKAKEAIRESLEDWAQHGL